MAGCWEWPKYDAFHESSDEDSDMGVVMYFRRWPARFGRVRHTETKLGPFGTGDTRYREYDAVENIEKHRLVTCPPPGGRRQGYSRPEDSAQRDARLRWICGSV
eukprot:CAMPEP_0174866362 /NCGR_PEP_ID=MMETSP1114-20130205/61954_1 /TAXON_ID=312471 /ORGANISM="Neobodo designis, Strain CCAP 1951/1" /LENGTH=103 /DNA_ID=CAMNT_0016101519 /DNA_START=111 /DNA_END=419 /DNA_ORIENTATION=+